MASPFYAEEGVYQPIGEAWFGPIKFFRIRFSEGYVADCPADDFTELEETRPDPFFINVVNQERIEKDSFV